MNDNIRTLAVSIIAVGNPGAGKSTILNSLAGEVLFKSGVSIGCGLTYQLDERENSRGRFYDTPGLADETYREAAGKAISTALRKGGPFKILFFVRTESGRLIHEDITTFKLVLASAPEIGNNYGIITNKLPKNVAKLLLDPDKAAQLLTKLFASIPEERRCAQSSLTYLPHRPEAESEENYLVELECLKTLKGLQLKDFVYGQVPTAQLTHGAAKEIETGDFDKMTKLIETLEKKMDADKEMFEEQKRSLLKQLEKAEEEKIEQRRRDNESFMRQMIQMKTTIQQKDQLIEEAKGDARRHEELLREQMRNQREYERQQFQNQQVELADMRKEQQRKTEQDMTDMLQIIDEKQKCIVM